MIKSQEILGSVPEVSRSDPDPKGGPAQDVEAYKWKVVSLTPARPL